ncbi:serine/threonine transporter SstT [Streptococcus cuniculipharyngis]|uniref:Serine/threonine transporter SstT n=1 Tax=Streptococcus cuniculipharyngis TaxID=1562651 RepID=A0A5C5SBM1_9STRE|nr:serine/threonine transporter SstT [Streptococcus cuniculipharyngis]TWS98166.1 serine/threonine transporter SstT [Streptococcus cuniculipharyngis]
MKNILQAWGKLSLIQRIIIGVVIGAILGLLVPSWSVIGLFGTVFVGALKGVAPILVFVLVAHALSQSRQGHQSKMKSIIALYLLVTFAAAFVAVIASFLFPVTLNLAGASSDTSSAPQGIAEVFTTFITNIVDNPINAIANANYIGVLSWAVLFGLALRQASDAVKDGLGQVADATSKVVTWVISLAPFGIMGLVFSTISENGMEILTTYGRLLLVLVGTMAVVALVVNPLIAFIMMKENPYPLVFRCLKESGLPAFFTRSSAANIPVNMKLCKDLGLNEDTYSVSIPLGATVNMGGAAITITVLTLAAVNTLGIAVDFPTAFLLSVVAALSACGASGVAGGSLLLIPLACSLFGIDSNIASEVVGVGFIIGVIQDSCETAINSSTDVLFTAVAEKSAWGKK